ncbi:MAG: protein-disulfide reductase DsbD domain-containing protein [Rhizobiaceae bacterium]
MKQFFALSLLTGFAIVPQYAFAASTQWFPIEGGEIRLVTAGGASENGRLRGALEIVLQPGWKTYWLDPGDAGVPPQIDVSNSRNVTGALFKFPAPQRFDDGYAVWAGYKNQVSLAVEFDVGDNPHIDAEIFLGVCEKICVPVQLQISLDPARDSDLDIAAVDAAFAGLPKKPKAGFRLEGLEIVGTEMIEAKLTLPEVGDRSELFLASQDGWYFGTPVRSADGKAFEVPLLGRPNDDSPPPEFVYTLVHGHQAVTGAVAITGVAVK